MILIQLKNFLLNPGSDGLNIASDTHVDQCNVEIDNHNPKSKTVHHWDWLQIIARVLGFDNRQYAGAKARNIKITDNVVDGRGSVLQCIFSMDGVIENILVSGNTLDTAGEHFITLAGVKSGVFIDNVDFDGEAVPAILEPLTIAGDLHVLSFLDEDDEYLPCTGVFKDLRRVRTKKPGHTDLVDFDYKGFTDYVHHRVPAKGSAKELLPLIRDAAFLYGNVLTDQEDVIMEATKTQVTWMRPSNLARDLGILSEGKSNTVYADPGNALTIGIGHKLTREELATHIIRIGNKSISINATLTDDEVDALYQQDIEQRVKRLNKLLSDASVQLKQYQFDALFDFYFNIGYGQFVESTVWSRIQSGEFDGVPDAMSWWKYDTVLDPDTGKKVKKELDGLVSRRRRSGLLWQNMLSESDLKEDTWYNNRGPATSVTNLEYNDDRDSERDYRGYTLPPVSPPPSYTPPPTPDRQQRSRYGESFTQNTRQYADDWSGYHQKPTDSSTIRNIYYMLASFIVTLGISQFGLPEWTAEVITPHLATIIGVGVSFLFGASARKGRLTATKKFKLK